jgi:hypothetical protein
MEASINGDLNMIKLLLQYKADVVARDDDDWTVSTNGLILKINDFVLGNRSSEGIFGECRGP